MAARKNRYRSVNLTRFSMKLVGLWMPETKCERVLFKAALVYAVLAIIFAIAVVGVDFYFCYGDFDAVMNNLCVSMLLVMILIKFSSFIVYRDLVYDLISYAEKNFWQTDYDEYDTRVVEECDRKGVALIYSFTVMVQIGALNYIYIPIIAFIMIHCVNPENRGRNETDRVLPFKLWVDFPVTTTPYYEIIYTIQSLSTLHSGICTFCFDNFVCCFNVHVAGQLKILAHKFEVAADRYVESVNDTVNFRGVTRSTRSAFTSCISDHLNLIGYVELMERAFTWIILGQLLFSSMLICIGVFQFLNGETMFKKFIFVPHFLGSISQLFLYTWTCNDITYESEGISWSAYSMKWHLLPNDETGKMMKHGILMILLRVRQPCVLTAGKFVPVSLQTFRSIFSTAASYLTILQQMSEETS